MSVTIVKGDLLAQPVDCIVNPANGFLMHGAGLARLIADRATDSTLGKVPQTFREARRALTGIDPATRDRSIREAIEKWHADNRTPTIPTGGVHVTSAGVLPFKGVIHAVGPIWGGGELFEPQLLALAHANACAAAHERGWRSIGFPAVSCGLFRFPVEKAAPVALNAVRFFALPQPDGLEMDVTFALFEDAHYSAFAEAAINADVPYRILESA